MASFSASTDFKRSPPPPDLAQQTPSASSSRGGSPRELSGLDCGGDDTCLDPPQNLQLNELGSTFGLFREGKRLCVRHTKMADSGTSLRVQESLDSLPIQERAAITALFSTFSNSSHPRRELILRGLLTMCCFSQLSLLSSQLTELIRIDPFSLFPKEVSLKVLSYLDPLSLGQAVQVCKSWKELADDDILWRTMCEQHIERRCLKCGWGLPRLERERLRREIHGTEDADQIMEIHDHHHHQDATAPPYHPPQHTASSSAPSPATFTPSIGEVSSCSSSALKRRFAGSDVESEDEELARSAKRASKGKTIERSAPKPSTRPWKDVYCERLVIERNWRKGRFVGRTLKGHNEGVMCLQMLAPSSSSSPTILITGSLDRTARVWNLQTGEVIRVLRGHTRAIRALQFDSTKLVTGSTDRTLKVWNWRTGMQTLPGHTDGIVCLQYDKNILASGSADSTIKIWNFHTAECFTLRGHTEWVNSVVLWDGTSNPVEPDWSISAPAPPPHSDSDRVGKMLFSGSDDTTIRLWDLTTRECVRVFDGHVGQVQSLKLLIVDPEREEEVEDASRNSPPPQQQVSAPSFTRANSSGHRVGASGFPLTLLPVSVSANPFGSPSTVPGHPGADSPHFQPPQGFNPTAYHTTTITEPHAYVHENNVPKEGDIPCTSSAAVTKEKHHIEGGKEVILISASLDNTVKLWDVDTGVAKKTFFGHIEGVWGVDGDPLRMVSCSHDRTIKVWSREDGKCTQTLVGHRGAVTCVNLTDTQILSGSDDGEVRIWSFAPPPKS